MPRRRLIWKVAPGYIIVIALSTVMVAYLAGQAVRTFFDHRAEVELTTAARLIARQVRPMIEAGDIAGIERLCRELAPDLDARITVIAPDGRVLGDSEEDPAAMDNHSGRPEVVQALAQGLGRSDRYSHTVEYGMKYVAISVKDDQGRPIAVVRTAFSLAEIDRALAAVRHRIALGGLVLALLAGALTFIVFARHISGPIQRLQQAAERFASGDLDARLPLSDAREISDLAESLNVMARQLDEKILAITRESAERQAILASMIEGVLAIDAQERVLTINQAAAELFRLDPHAAAGRRVFEVVRHSELHQLVTDTLAGDGSVERDLVVRNGGKERRIRAHGAPLRETAGPAAGAVVVLHDVTRIHDLEQVRRQFVANVSHELKTPISAIHGAVETLLDPRGGSPDDRQRFLAMIQRQALRLNAIVEDLLALARLEQRTEADVLDRRVQPLMPIVLAAVESVDAAAQARRIKVVVRGDEHLGASVNSTLISQAVVNLLDNAIKYGGEGAAVVVKVERDQANAAISVSDNGPGIAAEHLPRLFERFYRVDQGRSREMGGTGLGLAIVKHIAQAHGGKISVDSRLGAGATFRIILPPA